MEVPLTPLEFARRARAPVRATARPSSTASCASPTSSSSTAATAGRRRCSGSASSRATASPTSRRNTHAQLESFYAVPQIGAVLVPINYRLTADDFAYIIDHSGATVVCAHADYLDAVDGIRAAAAGRRALRRARRRAATGWLDYEALLAAAPPAFDAAADRRARPADDQLHQRHDLAPQGRDDHAPQRLHERRRHAAAPADGGRPTATCGRCRCSTPTAGRSPGSSPRSAARTSACARSSRRRSSS